MNSTLDTHPLRMIIPYVLYCTSRRYLHTRLGSSTSSFLLGFPSPASPFPSLGLHHITSTQHHRPPTAPVPPPHHHHRHTSITSSSSLSARTQPHSTWLLPLPRSYHHHHHLHLHLLPLPVCSVYLCTALEPHAVSESGLVVVHSSSQGVS
ncbi:hypothetical protein M758_7G165400 [Ceratodon purpureus]|nr:hypothetical protein M758_7G165400 [Ceratodon purpureus]